MLHGKCSCGAVSFAIDALPREVHYCHCTQCRRATGSAFAVLVWCDDAQLTWFGEPAKATHSSQKTTRGFCGACGSPLYMKHDDSGETGLYIGAFDEPQSFVPSYHYGAESRLVWCDVSPNLPSEECERKTLIKKIAGLPGVVMAKERA